MVKNTYGTGCFMLMNTGDALEAVAQRPARRRSAAQLGGRAAATRCEGSVFIAGAVVQWLRDGLQVDQGQRPRCEALAASVPDNGGVYVVPAFTGLGAPHWDPYARGTIVGLTRGTTIAHIARAALEAIAFQSADAARGDEQDATPRHRAGRRAARRRRRLASTTC